MRFLVAVTVALACAAPASAEELRLQWPLRPVPSGVPVVSRAFNGPVPDWQRGHRGVDLIGDPGQPVYAAGPGTVVFAGVLAGRPVVSVDHPGGLRTSYEPVAATVNVALLPAVTDWALGCVVMLGGTVTVRVAGVLVVLPIQLETTTE